MGVEKVFIDSWDGATQSKACRDVMGFPEVNFKLGSRDVEMPKK